ncbi:DNA primase [Allocoleopsis franciscana]|uniref:DNA primase n=1 Tax=Allocoleopsis franciscana PCC 7113 TaxID=1173027 RepID=K9WM05_9CYAN|nr:DNA primase [Allocoleopsis franciscana]AFZ20809.1 DNA primase, catalytic core [Allocoleopsis franciscana PCC 7113]
MEIPRLHPDTIDDVKQRADIYDVVSDHVVLRKRGKDYVGLCPFHDEKTPSFSVSPSKQMYYCFGCNAGGNAVKFLMEVGKRSFSDVILDLARRYQVPVKTLEPEQRESLQRQLSLREQLYEILALATAFYQHALRQPQGQAALEYLKSERRLCEETIQQFQLGYAPGGWETLYKYLVEQKGKPVHLVEQAGLIAPRKEDRGYYDRFRDRLMIPIHDTQGRIIGFGGRTLKDEQPKYLNSPDTPLFDKGKTLFALDKARDAISKQDKAVVVEGYFDAIALHAAGITNVVASLGTALSEQQVKLLLRYTESKQIILNFDADKAGTQASLRAIEEIADLAYKGQVQLRVLNLPGGKDADEFLSHFPNAAEQYRNLLSTAPLWLDWQIDQLLSGKNLNDASQFQQLAQEMVKLLSRIDNDDTRAYYVRNCGEILSQGDARLVPLRVEYLFAHIKRKWRNHNKENNSLPPLNDSSERNLLEQAEALLLRIYLHRPEYRQTIIDTLEAQDLLFSLSPHRFLWQQILELQSLVVPVSPQTSDPLISLLQERSMEFPEQMRRVAHLFHLDEKRQEDIVRTPLLIQAATASLERVTCEKHRRYCLEQWQKLNPATEPERWKYYSQEFYKVDQRIKELDQLRQFNISDIIKNSFS